MSVRFIGAESKSSEGEKNKENYTFEKVKKHYIFQVEVKQNKSKENANKKCNKCDYTSKKQKTQ